MTQPETVAKVPVMGRPAGRKTKTVRVYEDLADEVGKMCDALGIDTAELLDSIIRPALEKRRPEAAAKLRERLDSFLGKKRNDHKGGE
jgi:hypothetical protein